jgi:3-deoxy-7-phosphoheptulonate synthase
MIIHFNPGSPEADILRVQELFGTHGVRTVRSSETVCPIIAAVDKVSPDLRPELEASSGVAEVIDIREAWRQVDRQFRKTPTVVDFGNIKVGEGHPCAVIAGPCSVEGRQRVLETAEKVKEAGAHMLRGGAFKPRTSPYAFQGFGVEGLRQLKDAGDAVGLPVISEIMDASHVDAFVDNSIDCLQIGARNMQNFTLLKAVAKAGIPVLLKRGLSATVKEWLFAAEYLMQGGCDKVILCERGIRTFETATRNTLDLTILPLLRQWTHLPIVVDPAHACGISSLIPPLSRASVAVGADGITVEMHLNPSEARSDGPQALLPAQLKQLVAEARVLSALF